MRPDMYLSEYVKRFQLDLQINVSEPTVCRGLEFLKKTRKKKKRSSANKFTDANLNNTANFRCEVTHAQHRRATSQGNTAGQHRKQIH